MIDFIKWLIFISALGWLLFPVVFSLFNKAVDKGFSIIKICGLLFWGYIFWIGNSFGLISNNFAGVLISLLAIVLISFWFFRKNKDDLFLWISQNRKTIIFFESVYVLTFLIWSIVRAANPELIGTEKPMELAFINGIHQSPSFPPSDPWLSGYAISYYYFGYLLVSCLMFILGTASGVAFNLTISLWFSLIFLSAAGVLFNLLSNKNGTLIRKKLSQTKQEMGSLFLSLVAPFFILLMGNMTGFLEMLHSRAIFWSVDQDGNLVSSFWKWLEINELNHPPALPFDWVPDRLGGTWWWRASRVLQDYTLTGQPREIIDEFPFFSFLLADLHPHVLAIPFVILSIYICVYVFVFNPGYIRNIIINKKKFNDPFLFFAGFSIGSLLFINTWDFPIYYFLFVLCAFVIIFEDKNSIKWALLDSINIFIQLGVICLFFYIPFILGLSSQAAGFLPSLIFKTRGIHYFVMFFPHLVILLCFIFHEKKLLFRQYFFNTLVIVFLIILLILFFSLMYGYIVTDLIFDFKKITDTIGLNFSLTNQVAENSRQLFLNIYSATNFHDLVKGTLNQIITQPGLILFLILLLSLSLSIVSRKKTNIKPQSQITNRADKMVFIFIFLAATLSIIPEFFYLRDQFGWRMNTIFKFYFQVWILFSLISGFILSRLLLQNKNRKNPICLVLMVTSIFFSLAYPFFAIKSKTNNFKDIDWTIDGNNYFLEFNPLEFEAIQELMNLPYGVVAEAVGGSYSNYGRVSRLTGYPTILGWPGHEIQWRGGMSEIGNREEDIQSLYSTTSWEKARTIMQLYNINYVFIGDIERSTYNVREEKFSDNLNVVFKNANTVIYSFENL